MAQWASYVIQVGQDVAPMATSFNFLPDKGGKIPLKLATEKAGEIFDHSE